jgi:hypothetical protein
MIGNRITARRALPSPGTVHATLERDHPFSITVQTRERHLRPRALALPSPASAIGSNGSSPASWGTAPPAADRLRPRPAGPGTDDLTASGNKPCVDSGLASFGAFCGVFSNWTKRLRRGMGGAGWVVAQDGRDLAVERVGCDTLGFPAVVAGLLWPPRTKGYHDVRTQ